MNNKMKKVSVEIEIPEHMEIFSSRNVTNNLVEISLHQRKPRELKFREIVGRDYINTGEYFTDNSRNMPTLWIMERFYFEDEPGAWRDTDIWELVNAC